jgi:predicted NBD/HSP70 family sugar kinase
MDVSTISLAIKRMRAQGIVCERGAMKASRGRPKTRLAIAEDIVVCGVEITASGASIAVVDLSGRILALDWAHCSRDMEQMPAFLSRTLQRLDHDPRIARVEGVGITLASDLWSGMDETEVKSLSGIVVKLKAKLEKSLGVPVEVESEIHSIALGESMFGSLSGVANAVLVHVGDTVSATRVSNGRLFAGTEGWSGQIAHLMVDPNGAACPCGQRGCLDTTASMPAVLERYRMAGNSSPIGIQEFLNRVESLDPLALQVLAVQVEGLASGLRALLLVVSTQAIVVAGPIVKIWDQVQPMLQEAMLSKCGPCRDVKIHRSSNPDQMRMLGAAAAVLCRHDRY